VRARRWRLLCTGAVRALPSTLAREGRVDGGGVLLRGDRTGAQRKNGGDQSSDGDRGCREDPDVLSCGLNKIFTSPPRQPYIVPHFQVRVMASPASRNDFKVPVVPSPAPRNSLPNLNYCV
jgi:hypothetical protein